MGKEFELKYTAPAAMTLSLMAVALKVSGQSRMATTYYDTPSGALASRKWTLRLRRENEASVVTMKTAGDGHTRGEWEYRAEDLEDAACQLTALGAPEELKTLTAEGLCPVCGAEFTRMTALVRRETTVLEVALDLGRLFREDRQLPLCEVEVELKEGDPAVAVAFAGKLAKKYELTPEPRSKFVRAVNL